MSQNPPVYLICYDIVDNRRRYRLDKLLKGYGLRVQRSVFECAVEVEKLARLKTCAWKLIKPEEDRLHIYRLCGKDNRTVKVYGRAQRIRHPDYWDPC